jgi:hypothetical protein
LPAFVIIGAQRAGTTTLYEHLARHPQVRPPVRKEIQFLTLHWHRGLRWYRSNFPIWRGPRQFSGEASPYYLFHPAAPRRAALTLPSARFIALLREPSARAVSHYLHNRANGLEPLDLDEALALEAARLDDDPTGRHHRLYSYVARGLYAEQVRRWRAAVGDRLLVLLSDELFEAPRETLGRVQAFIGLDPWQPDDFPLHSPNRSAAPAIEPTTTRRLQETFAAPNRELEALLGRDLTVWCSPREGVGPSFDDARLPSVAWPDSSPDQHRLGTR